VLYIQLASIAEAANFVCRIYSFSFLSLLLHFMMVPPGAFGSSGPRIIGMRNSFSADQSIPFTESHRQARRPPPDPACWCASAMSTTAPPCVAAVYLAKGRVMTRLKEQIRLVDPE
jgi:hypothetical protein